MKTKSPLTITQANFYAYSNTEKNENDDFIYFLNFDNRRDFAIDYDFAGIAVRFFFMTKDLNATDKKGIRRKISVTLVDTTLRLDIMTHLESVYIPKESVSTSAYIDIPPTTDIQPNHTYKFIIRDEKASETLQEYVIHTFAEKDFGHPTGWYTVNSAALQPDNERGFYKSIAINEDNRNFYLRFGIKHNFGKKPPMIMPEVEICLYKEDIDKGFSMESWFFEPKCVSFLNNIYEIRLPLYINIRFFCPRNYYAELRCMGHPVAGFTFTTKGPNIEGEWTEDALIPLKEKNKDSIYGRFRRFLPEAIDDKATLKENKEDDISDFDSLIDEFIASQKEESDDDKQEYDNDGERNTDNVKSEEKEDDNLPLLSSLDNLTGLSAVKEKLLVYEHLVRFNKIRTEKNLPISPTPLHTMFIGSPGTGKTTVAKIIGKMLHRAGILSKGHVVIRERATLIGKYYGSEAEKTIEALQEAKGGILFIDEAYQLYQPDDPRDPGKFVIETLLTTLADESMRDWMLILAGYPEEMKRMFEMNPGFKSRIPDSNIYVFEDFNESELMEIAENYLSYNNYSLTPEAHTTLKQRLATDYSRKKKNFGNARHVINLIQTEILPTMAVRVTKNNVFDEIALTQIQATDIPIATERKDERRNRVGFVI